LRLDPCFDPGFDSCRLNKDNKYGLGFGYSG
jgi:hypothetical protein